MSLLASDVSMTSTFINMDQEESYQQVEKQQSEGTHQSEEQVTFFIERLPEKVHIYNHSSFFKMGGNPTESHCICQNGQNKPLGK